MRQGFPRRSSVSAPVSNAAALATNCRGTKASRSQCVCGRAWPVCGNTDLLRQSGGRRQYSAGENRATCKKREKFLIESGQTSVRRVDKGDAAVNGADTLIEGRLVYPRWLSRTVKHEDEAGVSGAEPSILANLSPLAVGKIMKLQFLKYTSSIANLKGRPAP